MKNHSPVAGRARSGGFTLIELMIAMLLGLVIVGSVMGVMLANRRTNRTTEGLSQVQESARTAYELLAHDLRQADGNGCLSSETVPENVLNAAAGLWWQNWVGIRAYNSTQTDPAVAIGTAVGERVAGTDSIRVQSIDGNGYSVAVHNSNLASPTINVDAPVAPDFVVGDIMVICDIDQAAVFQVSSYSYAAGVATVGHSAGVGTPGNCQRSLGPNSCAGLNIHKFPINSQIGRLVVTDWYIGNNGRTATESGRSLYRRRLGTGGNVVTEEVVAGVTDLQLEFRATAGNSIILSPAAVTDWLTISSVLVAISAQSADVNVAGTAANNGRVNKTFNYLISLRNRLP